MERRDGSGSWIGEHIRGRREGRDSGWEEKRWWRRKMMRKRRVENREQWFQKRRLGMIMWKEDANMAGVNHCQDTWSATRQERRIGSTKGTGPNMHAWKGKRIGGLSRWSAGPKGDDTFGGLRFARELVLHLGEQNQSSGPSIFCQDSGRHHNVIGLTMDQWRISNAMKSVLRWLLMWSGLRECRKWITVLQGWANNYTIGFAWFMKAGLRKRVSMQRLGDVEKSGTGLHLTGTVGLEGLQIVWLLRKRQILAKGEKRREEGVGFICRKQRDRGGEKEEPESKLMADGVTKLMEKLKFSEEELMEVGEMEGTQLGNVEGSEKWLVGHGWELCSTRPDGFEGPFQYGDWLKVDMGQPLQRKKLGIVYKNPRRTFGLTEGGEGSSEERSMGIGKGTVQKDRGRTGVSGGSRFRTGKRMLQGKNEVCNPIAMKKSRQSLSCQGCDEDEVSKATSPIKIIPTVEAAGQPRREP
ncbi:hypothetical protein V6N13_008708 [Hibiscus sabdariffa]